MHLDLPGDDVMNTSAIPEDQPSVAIQAFTPACDDFRPIGNAYAPAD